MSEQIRLLTNRFKRFAPTLFILVMVFSVLPSCGQRKNIVHDLDEREANEIVVFLDRKGITADKQQAAAAQGGGGQQEVKYDIVVDSTIATEAMAILNQHGLPRKKDADLLSLFSQGGLVPSELEEKVKYEEGLSRKIAATIRKIDGVLDAVVQISFPEEDLLNPDAVAKQKTASVYVKHQGVLDDPNSQLTTKIKRMVASSVEGLSFENVTIIPDRTRLMGEPDGISSQQREARKEYTKVWGVVLAKESVGHFQTIFLSFSIIIVILLGVTGWVLFRTLPIVMAAGGIMALLSLKPLTPQAPEPVKETKPESTEPAEDSDDDEEEDTELEDEESTEET